MQAIADSYIVQLKSGTDFSALAAKKGFTDVQSLGGDGFYSFDSTLAPARHWPRWGENKAPEVIDIDPNTPVQAASVPTPVYPRPLSPTTPTSRAAISTICTTMARRSPIFLAYHWYRVPQAMTLMLTQAWRQRLTGSVGSQKRGRRRSRYRRRLSPLPDLINIIWTNEPEANGTPGLDNDGDGYIDDVHGWNFIGNNNDVNDDNGHGTNVAGIIGAQGNNGIGIAGVNWNISMIPVKVLDANGQGTTATIIAGLEYITTLKNLWVSSGGIDGANITAANLSLGDNNFPYDAVEASAYQRAGAAGIIIVAAAGNGTNDNGTPINLDNNFGFPGKYSLNLPNVITVASVDNQGNLSLFSNYGAQSVQIAAPGENIISTFPIDLDTTDGNQDGYAADSGTSQATPHVTGIIALMASVEPNATAAQLKQALFSSVDPLPSLEPLTSTTTGKVTTGGEVNAYKALLAIQNIFVQSDTYTKGNWQGFGAGDVYGTSGAYIAGESTSFPAGVSITGGSTEVLG